MTDTRREVVREPGRVVGERSQHSETSAEILRAARVRFALYPYADCTIRDIAHDAGVSAALVIKYFGSKEQLLRAVVDYDEALGDLVAGPLTGLGRRLVAKVVDRIDDPARSDPFLALVLMAVGRGAPEWVRTELLTHFVDVLARRLDGPDADLRAELVCAHLIGLSSMRQVFESPAASRATSAELSRRVGPRLQTLIDG